MDYIRNGLNYCSDKAGDATLYILDEVKFWGEVIIEFMEWDKNESDNMLEEYRNDIKDHVKEM